MSGILLTSGRFGGKQKIDLMCQNSPFPIITAYLNKLTEKFVLMFSNIVLTKLTS
jgi:hypothetical protein